MQIHRIQSRTIGSHQAGDIGTDDADAELLFEGAKDGIVEESSALDDDLLAKLILA